MHSPSAHHYMTSTIIASSKCTTLNSFFIKYLLLMAMTYSRSDSEKQLLVQVVDHTSKIHRPLVTTGRNKRSTEKCALHEQFFTHLIGCRSRNEQ